MMNNSSAINYPGGLGPRACQPERRRIIFPSLHNHDVASPVSAPGPYPHPQSPRGQPSLSSNDVGIKERSRSQESSPSPTDVTSNIQSPTTHLPLMRANSLDGILVPLPKLSLNEDDKSNQTFPVMKVTLNKRPKMQGPISHSSVHSEPAARKFVAEHPSLARSSSVETKASKSSIFGELRHRTYYPAATVPTHVDGKKAPARCEPRSSILRKKAPSSCKKCNLEGGDTSLSDLSHEGSSFETNDPCLSPEIPTLASPASIKSLHPHRNDSELESIGESEDDLERISDLHPKVLPRKECKVRRIQSDTIVAKNEEEHSRPRRDSNASCETSVSRHASLEDLANNKRISFDPHIKVFEFGVTPYEYRGGEKWWSEDELTRFKEEAIQRIRMRSMTKIIPTGTGRALAVPPSEEQVKARASSGNNKAGGKAKGSVLFNHPALGCDDEIDESHSTRRSSVNDYLSQEIRNILVVDPHEVFLSLFTKSLKHMIPHASVATARSADEAITRIEAARKALPLSDGGATHGFDIIIIEERLRVSFSVQHLASGSQSTLQPIVSGQAAGDDSIQRRWSNESGSGLIHYLVESEKDISKSVGGRRSSLRRSLLVGVSARLAIDKEKLEKSGADCIWGKPPPEMNTALRNDLLKLLMKKRNRK